MTTDKSKNPHAGHRRRMRERYEQSGFRGWAEHEVLEFMLFDAIPRRDTNKIAHDIIDKFGSIENVLHADIKELVQIDGIGTKTAEYLKKQEKMFSYCRDKRELRKRKLYDKNHPEKTFLEIFTDKKREALYMLCLDGNDRIIRGDWIFEGSFENVELNINTMVLLALKFQARKIVLAHNHPSGILTPSDSDRTATKLIITAMTLMGIIVYDHVIVGEDKCAGFIDECRL